MEPYCLKFYSEEDKHIAVNRFSIAEAELYSKEHIKYIYIYIYIYIHKYTYYRESMTEGQSDTIEKYNFVINYCGCD